MSTSLLLSFQEGVTAQADDEGTVHVLGPGGTRVGLPRVSATIRDALLRLAPPGIDPDRLRAHQDAKADRGHDGIS